MDCQSLADAVYGYFSQHTVLPARASSADVAVVFGRADLDVAKAAAEVYHRGLVTQFIVSGGVGKDSGELPHLGLTEAKFVAAVMTSCGVPLSSIVMEEAAKNGADNSRLSIGIIRERGLSARRVMLIGHRTNLWRVYLTHLAEADKLKFNASYQLVASPYTLSEPDTGMMLAELDRLIEWPKKGWAKPVPPSDEYSSLVARYARLKEAAV